MKVSMKAISRNQLRKRRHRRVRGKVFGTAKKPRLNVFVSLRFIYVQAVDDENNKVLTQANSKEFAKKTGSKNEDTVEKAARVGKTIAERLTKTGIKEAVFDRGGYAYHGRVRALADAAREAGLKF